LNQFLTDLDTRDLDGNKSRLIAPLVFDSAIAGGMVIAFAGFETDWASIPQAAQAIIPRNGLWDWAAVIHDLGYKFNGAVPVFQRDGKAHVLTLERQGWDDILLEGMYAKDVSEAVAMLIYNAVRAGGSGAWAGHAAESAVYPIADVRRWLVGSGLLS